MKIGNTLMIVLVLVILAAVAGGGYLFWRNGYNLGQGESQVGLQETVIEENVEPIDVAIEENPDTLVASLVDVSGGTSTGMGYVLREGVLSHKVEATLPAPAGDAFYEGWLVSQPSGDFFSTGNMLLNPQGVYVLDFIGDNVDPSYNFVVITLETVKDNTPEAHILEGLAK